MTWEKWGGYSPTKWAHLIQTIQEFSSVSGQGLASIWNHVNDMEFGLANDELTAAIQRWNVDHAE